MYLLAEELAQIGGLSERESTYGSKAFTTESITADLASQP